jgi:hypothetical protein|tara:strand:+ start:2382 stop:2756 length:375 start_codon:yes stop_codon:yes gene_type:complete
MEFGIVLVPIRGKSVKVFTAMVACLMVVGCGDGKSTQVKSTHELTPQMMNEMKGRYGKKGVSVTALRLYHEEEGKYTGTGEFTWKDEKYKFTLDATVTGDNCKWNATPLTGNQELMKIFKYSTY